MEPFVHTDIKYVKTSNCAYHLVHKCPMKRSTMLTGSGFVVCVNLAARKFTLDLIRTHYRLQSVGPLLGVKTRSEQLQECSFHHRQPNIFGRLNDSSNRASDRCQTGFTREASESHRRCPLLYNPNLTSCPKLLCADSRLDFVHTSLCGSGLKRRPVDRELPTLLYLSSA
jgi:hypothetical protein